MKAGVTKHTVAVLTASTPVDGVRTRRQRACARRDCMANGRGVENEAGAGAVESDARRASADLEVSEIALHPCPEAGRMKRGLKTRSARTGLERWLAGPATAGLEISIGEGGRRPGPRGPAFSVTNRVGAQSVLACDTVVVQTKWGGLGA